jgi:hypothetical protein
MQRGPNTATVLPAQRPPAIHATMWSSCPRYPPTVKRGVKYWVSQMEVQSVHVVQYWMAVSY